MATFTVSSGNYIRPVQGGKIKYFKEAPSQTFIIGDPLILGTDANEGDQVKISGSDPAAIVGIAAEAASGVEDTMIGVWVPSPDTEFIVWVEDAEALDRDNVGDEFGIVADTTYDIWRLDQDETAAPVFHIVRLAPGYAHGDVNGAYIATIKAADSVVYK